MYKYIRTTLENKRKEKKSIQNFFNNINRKSGLRRRRRKLY